MRYEGLRDFADKRIRHVYLSQDETPPSKFLKWVSDLIPFRNKMLQKYAYTSAEYWLGLLFDCDRAFTVYLHDLCSRQTPSGRCNEQATLKVVSRKVRVVS